MFQFLSWEKIWATLGWKDNFSYLFFAFNSITYTVLHMFRQVLFGAWNQGNHRNFDLSFLSYKCWLIFMGWSNFFFKKTKQNGWFKRTKIFNSANFQYSLARISGIGPWLRRKNWCDVAQSVWSSGCPMHWTAWLQCKLKKGLKMHFFVKYFTSLWLKLDWKHSIYIGAVSS